MKPINENWPNGLVCYTENDINIREFLVDQISRTLRDGLRELNPAVNFVRVETPCLVPHHIVADHLDSDFPLWQAVAQQKTAQQAITDGETYPNSDLFNMYLRPESTKGTYEMFSHLFPQENMLKKRLPLCIWQSGLSFRIEQDKSLRNLRFKQFYQLEFQLAFAENTMADYHTHAVKTMRQFLKWGFKNRQWDEEQEGANLPFYSKRTTDLYLDDWEVVAISSRKDFKMPILEISCGLDRLVAIFGSSV